MRDVYTGPKVGVLARIAEMTHAVNERCSSKFFSASYTVIFSMIEGRYSENNAIIRTWSYMPTLDTDGEHTLRLGDWRDVRRLSFGGGQVEGISCVRK